VGLDEEAATDFRSQRMPSPEGYGNAQSRWRSAWDAYARTVERVATPAIEPAARRLAGRMTTDTMGFWLMWHLEGGFEGLQRLGMSRSGIYRRINTFRKITGSHPDEFELPGVTIDVEEYLTAELGEGKKVLGPRSTHPGRTIRD
jgi:hypothetical protein